MIGTHEVQLDLPGLAQFEVRDGREVLLGGERIGWVQACAIGSLIGVKFCYHGIEFKALSAAALQRKLRDWKR